MTTWAEKRSTRDSKAVFAAVHMRNWRTIPYLKRFLQLSAKQREMGIPDLRLPQPGKLPKWLMIILPPTPWRRHVDRGLVLVALIERRKYRARVAVMIKEFCLTLAWRVTNYYWIKNLTHLSEPGQPDQPW